jgi:ACS family tartrate transporter-like MFS transporter
MQVDLKGGSEEPPAGAVLRKVGLRLLPFLFLLYVVNILDRVNVGFARLTMLKDLGLTGPRGEEVYALGAGIFYIGYLVFEVPSNLILQRVGARAWIGRILVSWGFMSAAMFLVRGPWSFYALRFLLGVAEAGFFPGIILYLSHWFPERERARAVAFFMAASPLAGVLGNPLSGALLQYTNGQAGLAGWQWLFLVEGVPSVLLGFCTWFYLTDRPEQARWLTPPERDWLAARLGREARRREARHGLTRLAALANPRVCLLTVLYITVAVGANAYGFYAPEIIKGRFPGRGEFQIGLLASLPSLAAVLGMVVIGSHSDRTGERRAHVAGSALLAAAGWTTSALADDPWLVLAGLALAQVGMMSMLPTFWALPTAFLSGTAAAGGIALINSVGNLGGFVGPNLLGRLRAYTGTFTYGMLAVALLLYLGALLALCLRHEATGERGWNAPAGEPDQSVGLTA